MKIIISPAKKMNIDVDGLSWRDLPQFISEAEVICNELQSMSYDELKKLWKCNDKIAKQNVGRLKNMQLRHGLTPAIFAYEGIQYRYIAPNVFTDSEYEYIQEHLRILSAFYGLLRPFDGVTPYRLEMQSKLKIGERRNLYDYWENRLANQLFSETKCIINLASKEYSAVISKYLTDDVRFITCLFCEEKDGELAEKGTVCKMVRGAMVRYMAENTVKDPEKIKEFSDLGFRYSPAHSDRNHFMFIKRIAKEQEML